MNLESVILLLAGAQALLLALLTAQKRRALYANRFLSLLMAVYGIIILHLLLQDSGAYRQSPGALFVFLGLPFLAAPFHFLYVKYLLSRNTSFPGRMWWHFAPAVAVEALALAAALSSPLAVRQAATTNPDLAPPGFLFYNWLLVANGILYMGFSLTLLLQYRRTLKDIASSLGNIRLNWLMLLTVAALASWLIFLIENTLLSVGVNLSSFVLTSVIAALYVYTIGYIGLLKSEVFAAPGIGTAMHDIFESATERRTPGVKYVRSGLDADSAALMTKRLLALMEDKKPYRDSCLTLGQLAAMLSVSTHNLSEVINTQVRQNFYDFINAYRVRQVKSDLVDPAKKNLKLLAIAFDAGFNSKANFNRIFKTLTNLTPSDYRRQNGTV